MAMLRGDARSVVLCLSLPIWISACGSDDAEQPRDYPCRISAVLLTGFKGSCDTRSSTDAPGECREWHGDTTEDIASACTALGGTFDPVAFCPSNGRVLRCMLELDPTLKVLQSYYAPRYGEGSAADLCTRLQGRCLTSSRD
jgi:hypothetical protein